MSEVKLNLVDAEDILSGTLHGSIVDAAIAALSAEPETIPELSAALARYIKPLHDSSPFQFLRKTREIDEERWDAGLVIIDLASRIVAADSTYSQPANEGEINYHDGTKSTEISVLYRVPDDWLFVNSVEAYLWSRERRGPQRVAQPPLEAREVLYGAPLLHFIIEELRRVELAAPTNDSDDANEDHVSQTLAGIHARWLMTPREDLRGQSPRDVMLARREFIDFDLHTRCLQWTWLNEGPPCLSMDSFAYRFAGFGTHEWVVYYDLVRHLLWSAISGHIGRVDRAPDTDDQALQGHLEELKTIWLNEPQSEYDGRIPSILIENERKRLPIALRPRDMIIDEDCPMCQMFGDETSPLGMGVGFWHLDGSHMEDDFAFSFCRTREEWEAENHRRDEFNKEFDRKWKERQERIARGETLEPDPYFDPEPFDFSEDGPDALLTDSVEGGAVDNDSNEPLN
jgi:hypothetical protein